jgi:hypothetical protein
MEQLGGENSVISLKKNHAGVAETKRLMEINCAWRAFQSCLSLAMWTMWRGETSLSPVLQSRETSLKENDPVWRLEVRKFDGAEGTMGSSRGGLGQKPGIRGRPAANAPKSPLNTGEIRGKSNRPGGIALAPWRFENPAHLVACHPGHHTCNNPHDLENSSAACISLHQSIDSDDLVSTSVLQWACIAARQGQKFTNRQQVSGGQTPPIDNRFDVTQDRTNKAKGSSPK